jgi:hypothetical protein
MALALLLLHLADMDTPNTIITSAVDGNGESTSSNSVTFQFTDTPGSNAIAGFQCSLDNSAFSPCASPTGLTNLGGRHTPLPSKSSG